MSTPSRELLIASPKRWDEACFSVPAVRALAGSGLGVGVLCAPHQQAFWKTLPGLAVRTPESLNEDWKVALLWEDGPLAKFVRKAGIHKRLGPEAGKLTKHLNETLRDKPHPTEHRVQYYLKAVAEMGVKTAKPEYFSPAPLGEEPSSKKVLLCPDSDFGPSHEWPLERWQELAQNIESQGNSLTILSLASKRLISNDLHAITGLSANFEISCVDDESLLELLKNYKLVIAADGSIPHLAAHLGATCVTLFGPNDAAWKRPLGRRHQVVAHQVECSPCLMPKCPLDLRCQKELEVDDVLQAFAAVKL